MVATEDVWLRLSADLRAFFRRRVPDEHEAEDLLQDTFVRLHAGLGDLRDEERLAAWVFRIARRVLADHRRGAATPGTLESEPPADPEPEADNLNREVEGWLRSMVELLPESQREAVLLAEVEGLGQDEVARRLGLSHSGARSRVQRGRARLRAELAACCHLDFDRRGNVVAYRPRRGCRHCTSC